MAAQKALGGMKVHVRPLIPRPVERKGSSVGEDGVHHPAFDPLSAQLVAERSGAARMGAVPRLHPGAGERIVIEDAQLDQTLDDAIDELGAVAHVEEPPANLVDGSRPGLEEARRGREDHGWIVHGRPDGAPFGEGLSVAGRRRS